MTGDSFQFGTLNSVDDWGIRVVAYDYFLPPKRSRKISVPGRSGMYDFGAECWDERTLRIACTLERTLSKSDFREIVYQLSQKRQLRLWNEPEKFYMAELYDPSEVQDYFMESMRDFELNFICEPFAYGKTVSVPIQRGRNPIEYAGTAKTPCTIILKNTSTHNIANLKITAVQRS